MPTSVVSGDLSPGEPPDAVRPARLPPEADARAADGGHSESENRAIAVLQLRPHLGPALGALNLLDVDRSRHDRVLVAVQLTSSAESPAAMA
jgi:hypothetical protein